MQNIWLVVTQEKGGLDRYSRELARRLPVKNLETRRYLKVRENIALLRVLYAVKGLLHFPNQHFGRFAPFLRSPFLITVHDVARFKFHLAKETLGERIGLWLDKRGIRLASFIIAVSKFTQKELIKLFKVSPEKVTVVYNGIDHDVFHPKDRRPLGCPYLIYAGSERPRKNLGRLLEAFAEVKKEFPALKLVKVGEAGRNLKFRQSIRAKIKKLGLEKEVVFVGHPEDEKLAEYYSGASCLVYPSLYEGFGFPPLEAMACGCPVVASRVSSIPEVVGNAGLLFEPHNVEEMATAIRRALTDEELRKRLISRGFERARNFTWEKTAEKTWRVYRCLMENISRQAYAQTKFGFSHKAQQPKFK